MGLANGVWSLARAESVVVFAAEGGGVEGLPRVQVLAFKFAENSGFGICLRATGLWSYVLVGLRGCRAAAVSVRLDVWIQRFA